MVVHEFWINSTSCLVQVFFKLNLIQIIFWIYFTNGVFVFNGSGTCIDTTCSFGKRHEIWPSIHAFSAYEATGRVSSSEDEEHATINNCRETMILY